MTHDCTLIIWELIVSWKYVQVFRVMGWGTQICTKLQWHEVSNLWIDQCPWDHCRIGSRIYRLMIPFSQSERLFGASEQRNCIFCGFKAVCVSYRSGDSTVLPISLPKCPNLIGYSIRDGRSMVDRVSCRWLSTPLSSIRATLHGEHQKGF